LFEEGYGTADAGSLLPLVKARTLVVHRIDDPGFPLQAGQRIAAEIPNSQFVPLPGKESYYFLGDSRGLLRLAKRFLGDETANSEWLSIEQDGRQVRTILFTDLVGHTEMMRRLGDEKGREVLREHERITREVLKAHGGTEVKTMGDGFMASFGSVTKAVECAVALQKAMEEHNRGDGAQHAAPLQVRIGLNAGEPIEEDGDLFGSTVILASRVAGKAEGGEILASLAVRELSSGKGFVFADRGEFVAKGFEDPVRVFEVRWRDG